MTSRRESKGFSVTCGMDQSLYRRYTAMRARCNNKKIKEYPLYGGRGICVEWKSFPEFYNDMGKSFYIHAKKHGVSDTTLDRVDNNGNYCRKNCRWATRKEQSVNSSVPKRIEYDGETDSLTGWSRRTGICRETLSRRIFKYKWDLGKAFSTPASYGHGLSRYERT